MCYAVFPAVALWLLQLKLGASQLPAAAAPCLALLLLLPQYSSQLQAANAVHLLAECL